MKKLNYVEVKNYIENYGYNLLSQEYINSSSKLEIQCPNNHIFLMSFHSFKKGTRCPICFRINHNKSLRLDLDDINKVFNDSEFILVEDINKYKNVNTKLSCMCENGHITKKSYHDLKYGHGCKKCAMENSISSQQRYIHYIFQKGILNYEFNKRFLDIGIPNERIFIEYDGRGHDYRVQNGSTTLENFLIDEENRYNMLINHKWRGIRIISRNDRLPIKEELYNILNNCYNKLVSSDIKLITLDVDYHIIKYDNIYEHIEFNDVDCRISQIKKFMA